MADVSCQNVKAAAWSVLAEGRLVDLVNSYWPLLFGEVKGCKAEKISVSRRKKWAEIANSITK